MAVPVQVRAQVLTRHVALTVKTLFLAASRPQVAVVVAATTAETLTALLVAQVAARAGASE
jgi:hypothetical protein